MRKILSDTTTVNYDIIWIKLFGKLVEKERGRVERATKELPTKGDVCLIGNCNDKLIL